MEIEEVISLSRLLCLSVTLFWAVGMEEIRNGGTDNPQSLLHFFIKYFKEVFNLSEGLAIFEIFLIIF